MVVRSALSNGRFLPPGNAPGTHFCYRLSRPQRHSAIGRILCQWKMSMTTAGIEPATFGLVPTAVPVVMCKNQLFKRSFVFVCFICVMFIVLCYLCLYVWVLFLLAICLLTRSQMNKNWTELLWLMLPWFLEIMCLVTRQIDAKKSWNEDHSEQRWRLQDGDQVNGWDLDCQDEKQIWNQWTGYAFNCKHPSHYQTQQPITERSLCRSTRIIKKGKAVPLEARRGPEGSRKLRFPDFVTTAQDGGKAVSRTHRPPLPPGNTPGTHFC